MYGQHLICDPHEQVSCWAEIERKILFRSLTIVQKTSIFECSGATLSFSKHHMLGFHYTLIKMSFFFPFGGFVYFRLLIIPQK